MIPRAAGCRKPVQKSGWQDNPNCGNLVAWCWCQGGERFRVVINRSHTRSQRRIQIPWTDLKGWTCLLVDVMSASVTSGTATKRLIRGWTWSWRHGNFTSCSGKERFSDPCKGLGRCLHWVVGRTIDEMSRSHTMIRKTNLSLMVLGIFLRSGRATDYSSSASHEYYPIYSYSQRDECGWGAVYCGQGPWRSKTDC